MIRAYENHWFPLINRLTSHNPMTLGILNSQKGVEVCCSPDFARSMETTFLFGKPIFMAQLLSIFSETCSPFFRERKIVIYLHPWVKNDHCGAAFKIQ